MCIVWSWPRFSANSVICKSVKNGDKRKRKTKPHTSLPHPHKQTFALEQDKMHSQFMMRVAFRLQHHHHHLLHQHQTVLRNGISSLPVAPCKRVPLSIPRFISHSLALNQNEDKDDEANEYLASLGYTHPKIQEGMKDALKSVFGKQITVANIQSIGTEGEKKRTNKRGLLCSQTLIWTF